MNRLTLLLALALSISTAQAQFDYAFQEKIGIIKVVNQQEQREITVVGADPCLSPDGTKLVYTHTNTQDEKRKLCILDLITQTTQTFRHTLSYGGRWSPNGNHILFNEFDGNDWYICVQKADGSNFQRMGAGYGPTWQDNQTVVWHNMKDIFIQSIESSQPKVMAIDPNIQDSVLVSSATRFYYLPQLKSFLLNAGNAHAEAPVVGPNEALFMWNPEEKSVKTMTDYRVDVQNLSVTNDTLYYILSQKNHSYIYKQPIKGGAAVQIRKGWDYSTRSSQ